ncbi:hypothetical protein KC19_1G112500 [Ceratodon purpureus]|uniref:Uncharacterized protein n=1 Tax=Ceratodon purpureus TaxID=3225 RepID=A0A8T0J5T1_CERPU|nr:hypothetical protein KC19_1G112500 [Ceratodon purpureus]
MCLLVSATDFVRYLPENYSDIIPVSYEYDDGYETGIGRVGTGSRHSIGGVSGEYERGFVVQPGARSNSRSWLSWWEWPIRNQILVLHDFCAKQRSPNLHQLLSY